MFPSRLRQLWRVQGAGHVDSGRLVSVTAIPLAVALAMATAVALSGGAEIALRIGGPFAFLLGFVKFCYVGVGMAHLAAAVAESRGGGLAAGRWLTEEGGDVRASGPSLWRAFPNHLDGAAIAFAVALVCAITG